MTIYRILNRATGELLNEVYTAREFLDAARTASPEQAAAVRVVVIGRAGKEKEVEPLAESARLEALEVAKRERFEATHRKITVRMGVTPFACPRTFYVKK